MARDIRAPPDPGKFQEFPLQGLIEGAIKDPEFTGAHMTKPNGLAARLRDDLIANAPNAVRGLPIAEALSATARIDLVRQAKAKVDDLIAKWPWEEPEREAVAPGSSPKKAKSLKEMQRRLGMALELAAKGASILDGDEEQAINLVVAWLMFHGNTDVALPDGRIVEVSGKITLH